MNASKENAAEALRLLERSRPPHLVEGEELKFVREFLEAAMKKLPREESFSRERARTKKMEK